MTVAIYFLYFLCLFLKPLLTSVGGFFGFFCFFLKLSLPLVLTKRHLLLSSSSFFHFGPLTPHCTVTVQNWGILQLGLIPPLLTTQLIFLITAGVQKPKIYLKLHMDALLYLQKWSIPNASEKGASSPVVVK